MKIETAVARPFFKLEQAGIDKFMSRIAIRFREEEEFAELNALKVDVPIHEAQVSLKTDPTGLIELISPLEPLEVHLVVTFRDDTRRSSRVLLDCPLREIVEEIPVEVRNLGIDWLGSRGGLMSIYLAKRSRAEKEVGLPWFVGHVLGIKHFGINRTGPGAEFPVEFRSGAEFAADGFHSETAVAVVASQDDLRDLDIESTNIRIYVNDRLRGVMRSTQRSAKGRLMKAAIHSSALEQLLMVVRAAEGDQSLPEKSVGALLVDNVLKHAKKSRDYWRGIDPSDAGKLSGLSQAYCSSVKSMEDVK